MQILAHRGWWLDPAEKNTEAAFARAFASGYGVETDIRDHDGELVIAHDMPRGAGHMSFAAFLDLHKAHGQPGLLALNIKADGLHAPLADALARTDPHFFLFDMAVPDVLGYLARNVLCFTRHSEIEPVPAFYAQSSGVWMDCFERDWIEYADVQAHLDADKQVALVSPELHRRPHAEVWARWARWPRQDFLLCTDFPGEAAAHFSNVR